MITNKNFEIKGMYEYAKMLKGTDLSDSSVAKLAEAQAKLIRDNLHTKSEITLMIELLLAKFDQTFLRFEQSQEKAHARHEQEILKLEMRLEKTIADNKSALEKTVADTKIYFERAFSGNTNKIIAILGGLMGILTGVMTFLHFFVSKGP